MGYLSSPKIRKLQELRDRMIGMLTSRSDQRRQDLYKRLLDDPAIAKLFKPDALNESVGLVLQMYDNDFYRDPSTGRWSLTRRRQVYDAAARAAKDISARRTGNTACGKVAEFMDRAEA